MNTPIRPPIFLGLCNRAARYGLGWDLLGITHAVPFPFFPQWLSGLSCVLAWDRSIAYSGNRVDFKLFFTDDNDHENKAHNDSAIVFAESLSSIPSADYFQTAQRLTPDESGENWKSTP